MKSGRLILVPSLLDESNGPSQFPEDTLSQVSQIKHFIVERAKTARAFLKAIGYPHHFDEVEMIELNKHGEDDLDELFSFCDQGFDTGVISEAGVPGVADPGGELVRAAHGFGIEVVPLIGASSLLLALMSSGMNGQQFAFHGYLPRDERELNSKLRELERESKRMNQTQMFIETPYRNEKCFTAMLKSLNPATDVCVAASLVSPNQRIRTKNVSEWKKERWRPGKEPAVFLLFAGKMKTNFRA